MSERLLYGMILWAFLALIYGGSSEWIAGRKNRDGFEGFFLGLLFGPVGMLIEATLPNGPASSSVGRSKPVWTIAIVLLAALIPLAATWRLVEP
jgi:hypothetical protein